MIIVFNHFKGLKYPTIRFVRLKFLLKQVLNCTARSLLDLESQNQALINNKEF